MRDDADQSSPRRIEEAAYGVEERERALELAEAMAGVGPFCLDLVTGAGIWSEGVARIHGLAAREDSPGLDAVLGLYHPEDQKLLLDLLKRAADAGEGFERTFRLQRLSDGALRLVRMKTAVTPDAEGKPRMLIGALLDVTEAEAARRRSEEREALYRLVTENSMDLIMTVNAAGVIGYCSPAARHFGYEPEDLVGRNMADLVHPEELGSLLEQTSRLFALELPDNALMHQQRALTKSGDYVWVEGHSTLFTDRDGGYWAVTVIRDISTRKALEAALIRAKDQAEAGARAKAEFVANMSHELRTPLTSIVGFSGLLRMRQDLSPDAALHVQRIAAASASLLELINDVLDFSKLDEGRIALSPRACDVAALVWQTCDLFSAQAAAKNLVLKAVIGEGLKDLRLADDMRLRQILNNLVSNAVKFTDAGSVIIRAAPCADDPSRLRLEVHDTGRGLSKDDQAQLFDRFSPSNAAVSREFGGSGLGLSICRQLVDLMQGAMGVVSAPRAGSCFWIEAPCPVIDADAAPGVDQALATPALPGSARILVVDDHMVNRELICSLFARFDMSVVQASCGAEAIEACKAGPFDLILMDIQMPGMDGFAAASAIRQSSGFNARTPIIAVTARIDRAQRSDFSAAGIDDWLDKPIHAPRFYARVRRYLSTEALSVRNEATA